MKLPKAIEITSDPAWQDLTLHDPDFQEALRLLTEAGKRIQDIRTHKAYSMFPLLPGETEG